MIALAVWMMTFAVVLFLGSVWLMKKNLEPPVSNDGWQELCRQANRKTSVAMCQASIALFITGCVVLAYTIW